MLCVLLLGATGTAEARAARTPPAVHHPDNQAQPPGSHMTHDHDSMRRTHDRWPPQTTLVRLGRRVHTLCRAR